ncbi:hypothetical protein M8818_000247 [Zalaria obscura]|uniref:Uncharacterized protein n=1 Tax=Zalaria obscura TaxID=2024903 RepID=A0ACC3SQG1_9PEZI
MPVRANRLVSRAASAGVDRFEQDPLWAIPTPPRSESGVPTLTVDAASESLATTTASEPVFNLHAPTTSATDMGSLGYLLPSHYGPLASFEETSSDSSTPHHASPSISGIGQIPFQPPQMGSIGSQYSSSLERSPSIYDTASYSSTLAAPATQAYSSPHSLSYPQPVMSSNMNHAPQRMNSDTQVRVLNQRPKPQCWEHGCNGRQFSTFSNLLRHQREKSGTAAKSYCPKCGAEFTRTTARNGHLAHEKCTKQRRASDDK